MKDEDGRMKQEGSLLSKTFPRRGKIRKSSTASPAVGETHGKRLPLSRPTLKGSNTQAPASFNPLRGCGIFSPAPRVSPTAGEAVEGFHIGLLSESHKSGLWLDS